ncbi:endomucin [Leptodactylus fuscus]|uniref:endomucin n=1 Tax=Leptodactylus fuscus TaxID=238119 RepID=UPI003F4ED399
MKSIGADPLCLSVLILLSALPNIYGEDGNQITTVQSTSSGFLSTSVSVSSTIPTHTATKTENGSTPTPPPAIPTNRPSDVTQMNETSFLDPTSNQTKNKTEATTKVSNTTDQYRSAIPSSTQLTNANYTTINSTHATVSNNEIKPTDGTIEVNTTVSQDNILKSPEVSSDKIPTKHKDEEKTEPSKSKKGIIIGVGCVLASVVFVALIFLYKMCQNKPQATENNEVKVSAQTKESVKLLSVKTATPYSDSKRMSANQMESIEC